MGTSIFHNLHRGLLNLSIRAAATLRFTIKFATIVKGIDVKYGTTGLGEVTLIVLGTCMCPHDFDIPGGIH